MHPRSFGHLGHSNSWFPRHPEGSEFTTPTVGKFHYCHNMLRRAITVKSGRATLPLSQGITHYPYRVTSTLPIALMHLPSQSHEGPHHKIKAQLLSTSLHTTLRKIPHVQLPQPNIAVPTLGHGPEPAAGSPI